MVLYVYTCIFFSIFAEPTTTTEEKECKEDDDCKDNDEKTECKDKKCSSK